VCDIGAAHGCRGVVGMTAKSAERRPSADFAAKPRQVVDEAPRTADVSASPSLSSSFSVRTLRAPPVTAAPAWTWSPGSESPPCSTSNAASVHPAGLRR
jgi:hypothetical protein